MRKKLTIVMVLLLTIGGIMAQQNFHRGTLTTTDGRVFAGTAEYFNPFDNLNQIRFKADGQAEATMITAGKIKRFETESGIVLEGHLVSYDKADNRLETITYDTKVQTVTDTLLLRLLADGPRLFFHSERGAKHRGAWLQAKKRRQHRRRHHPLHLPQPAQFLHCR